MMDKCQPERTPESVRVPIQRQKDQGNIPLPRYMTAAAAGMDVFAAVEEETIIPPGSRALIPTGIAISLPEGFEAQIRPRSGLALRHGVTLLNSPGTIDADYRGEIKIILMNHGCEPFPVRRGDRIAQMVVHRVSRVDWLESDHLDQTGRGEGGFGHTNR